MFHRSMGVVSLYFLCTDSVHTRDNWSVRATLNDYSKLVNKVVVKDLQMIHSVSRVVRSLCTVRSSSPLTSLFISLSLVCYTLYNFMSRHTPQGLRVSSSIGYPSSISLRRIFSLVIRLSLSHSSPSLYLLVPHLTRTFSSIMDSSVNPLLLCTE